MSEHIVRQTRQKDAIREALSGNDEFISAQDLHRKLEDEGVHIGLATVYRQLNALVESGRADTVFSACALTPRSPELLSPGLLSSLPPSALSGPALPPFSSTVTLVIKSPAPSLSPENVM